MIPQVDARVLSGNPHFARLHKDLCNNRLALDGSTKITDTKEVKAREAFAHRLYNARKDLAKRRLLDQGLRQITYNGHELPDELHDTVRVVLARLEGKLAPEHQDLAGVETEAFEEHIEHIVRPLSRYFTTTAATLATIASPDRHGDSNTSDNLLETSVKETIITITKQRQQLHENRIALANDAAALLALYQKLYVTVVRVLEQTIHGSVARATRAHSDYLAQTAEGMHKKLQVMEMQVMQQVYTPEVREALKSKDLELARQNANLKRRIRDMQATVQQYQSTKGMKVLADEYAEVQEEIRKVQADLERLKR